MHNMLETSGVLLNPCQAATISISNHAWSKHRVSRPKMCREPSGIYILKKLTVSFRNSWSFISYLPCQVDTNTLNFELVYRAGRYTVYSIDYLTELF